MAECVSCGKKIPPGKFFCDQCYRKMKGRRGILKKVGSSPGEAPAAEQPPAPRIPHEGRTDAESPGEAERTEAVEPLEVEEKKPKAELTPASHKKVVSLKPEIDRGPVERSVGTGKRFRITITFSERTYVALSRLRRLGRGSKKNGGEAGGEAPPPAAAAKAGRRKGPHGRPVLKAVGAESKTGEEKKGPMGRILGYRNRAWDRGDWAAAIIITGVTALTIGLSFAGWVRIKWVLSENAPSQSIAVKGTDLGASVYVIMALVGLTWLYMAVTLVRKKPLLDLDFGILALGAGVIFIIIFFVVISNTDNILATAAGMIGQGPEYFTQSVARYERQTLWTAYFMVFLATLLAFSGLIRLSERRKKPAPAGADA